MFLHEKKNIGFVLYLLVILKLNQQEKRKYKNRKKQITKHQPCTGPKYLKTNIPGEFALFENTAEGNSEAFYCEKSEFVPFNSRVKLRPST